MCTTCAFTTATSSQVAVVRDATSAANPSKAASSSAHSLSEQPINANFLFLFLRLLVVLVKQDPKMLRSVYLCKNFPRRLWNSEKKQDSKAHFGNFSDFLVAEWKRGINQLRGDGRTKPTMSVAKWQSKPLEFDVRWRSSLPFDWHQDQERTSTDTGGITWHLTKEWPNCCYQIFLIDFRHAR